MVGFYLDAPALTHDANGVYIVGDMNAADGQLAFQWDTVFAFPKDSLYEGSLCHAFDSRMRNEDGSFAFHLRPVRPLRVRPGAPTYFFNTCPSNETGQSTTCTLWKTRNGLKHFPLERVMTVHLARPYKNMFVAGQRDSFPCPFLNIGIAQTECAVWDQKGTIWVAFNELYEIRRNAYSGVRLLHIDPKGQVLDDESIHWGERNKHTLDYYYPSLAASDYGHLMLVMNGSSLGGDYVSVFGGFVDRRGEHLFARLSQLYTGTANVGRDSCLDFSSPNSNASPEIKTASVPRWGDYNAVVYDSSSDCFWFHVGRPDSTRTWRTEVIRLAASAQRQKSTRLATRARH
jgi:hypothetical protein